MKTILQGCLALALVCHPPGVSAQSTCNMVVVVRHGDPARTEIRATQDGEKAILFTADLDVNTDGAARSYHPDDPRGRSIALNNIGNGITRIFDAEGQDITCTPRTGACFTRFIQTFEASRDARYAPSGHPRFETTHIIPWRDDPALGHKVPCTIADGPFAGFFVSQTSILVDPSAGICDQARYLDSLTMNAIVLPRGVRWSAQGTVTDERDIVVLRDRQTGILAFAIVGDRGPAAKIGEGTVALAAALAGTPLAADATFADIRRLARPQVDYLLFPARDIRRLTNGAFTQADIDRLGREALAAFGGEERLKSCAADPAG